MNLDRILNPRSVPSRNTARHDIGFILGPTTEPKLVQNPAAYFGHKGSPLAQALKEVVALLGNSPLARDWAQSIHGPLETSWESQSFSHNIADKLRGFEKKVTGTVNGVIDTLVQRHELVLRGEPGQAEVERLILVAMPPFEQVYDNIDLDHNAFPDSSWFRDYAARHHFGIRVPEDIRVMHQNDLKVGIELDLAGIQAMRRKHPSFSGNTQHSQNFPHGNQEENDDLFEDACSDYHKYFETCRSHEEALRMISAIRAIKSSLCEVIEENVIHLRYWYLFIPSTMWLQANLNQMLSPATLPSGRGRGSRRAPIHSLSHHNVSYTHHQRAIYRI